MARLPANRPRPLQTTMNILLSDYEYVLKLKEYLGQPVYDILHKFLLKAEGLEQRIVDLEDFQQIDHETIRKLERENETLKQEIKKLSGN